MKSFVFLIAFVLSPLFVYGQQASTGIDRSFMDTSARPGTDFFRYSCGGWMKSHPLTAEYSSYGVTEVLYDENQKQLRQLIEDFSKHSQTKGSLQQKIGSLYRLAMDSTRRNREGLAPIKPYLQRIDSIQSKQEYQLVCAQMEREGLSTMMFELGVDADQQDASSNLVCTYQGGLGLGSRDYYVNTDSATLKIIAAYRLYLTQLFQLIGQSEADAQAKTADVLRIEQSIAQASYSAVKLRDVEGNYHKMTYLRLLADYPGIDWSGTLLMLGFPSITHISVSQPEPIHAVERILQSTSLEDLKTYAVSRILMASANELDDQWRATSFEFSKVLRGAKVDRPRWKRAVSMVNEILGMAVGKMYVEKYFPESSKRQMLTLVDNLKKAFEERIQAVTWMQPATKRQAIDKLHHFIVKIGYPDTWRDYNGLQVDDSLSYFANLRRAAVYEYDYQIQKKVNKPVDKSEWLMTPQTINAYYNPSTNEICFPAGILQPPFFISTADEAYNYGGIGATIGHEMTHGFDDQGSQFDKDGNVKNWWTQRDKEEFNKRTKVISNYFSGITLLPGLKINGELTLGENIADHGGLKIAWLAYKNATKNHPLPTVDGLTADQRFFIAYGITWAENIQPELLRLYNTSDPHAPAKWRVDGALPQIDEWYKAFNIKRSDPLYVPKAKRVDIW